MLSEKLKELFCIVVERLLLQVHRRPEKVELLEHDGKHQFTVVGRGDPIERLLYYALLLFFRERGEGIEYQLLGDLFPPE